MAAAVSFFVLSGTETVLKILMRCSVLPLNMDGITKANKLINSTRLFCSGVPVRRRRLCAFTWIVGGDGNWGTQLEE